MAVPASAVGTLLTDLTNAYGETLHDGPNAFKTIGAFWDDVEHTRLRAASLEAGTIEPIALTDGRVAFECLWQSDLAAAFDSGSIPSAEQLDQAELETLRVKPDEAP